MVSKPRYTWGVLDPDGGGTEWFCDLIIDLHWEEKTGALASTVDLDIRSDGPHTGGRAIGVLNVGRQAVLMAQVPGGLYEAVNNYTIVRSARRGSEFTYRVKAFDPLWYLAQSQDDRIYPKGRTADQIIKDIAGDWGIPLGDVRSTGTALAAQNFRGTRLSNMIEDVLEETKEKGGGQWFVRATYGKLDLLPPMDNDHVCRIEEHGNLLDYRLDRTMEDMVTVVKVMGQADDGKRAPRHSTHEGATEYGFLQEILYKERHDSLGEAQSAARRIINERGMPERTMFIRALDDPRLRKYDRVRLVVPSLMIDRDFKVTSVSHNGDGTMDADLQWG